MNFARGYQENYSASSASNHDLESRRLKAKTIIAVLNNWYQTNPGDLADKKMLDVGASTGAMDYFMADDLGEVYGIDIDRSAIELATREYKKKNLQFTLGDAMDLKFSDESFDVIVCSHVYEHVPDADRLMKEMYRVLKPDGIVFFSAGNRFAIMEPHYRLPFLSFPPKWLANLYLKVLKRGSHYYEEHRSYWGLKKLVRDFELHDYTQRIILSPREYCVDYMIQPGGVKQRIASIVARYAQYVVPGYMWVLKKGSAK